jgi:hypothetical protein
MKIIHFEEWWFDAIPYFSTQSPTTSIALCQLGTCFVNIMPSPARAAKF